MRKTMTRIAVIGCASLMTLWSGSADAAIQRGTVLSANTGTKITAVSEGELAGTNTVTVEGDTTQVFTGVTEILVFGDGSAEIDVQSHNLILKTINGTRGVSIKVLVTTPQGAQDVDLNFSFDTGTRSDSVSIEAVNEAISSFDMIVNFDFGTRSSKMSALVENLGSAPASLVFNGKGGTSADDFELIGKGGGVFELAGRVEVDKHKIEIEGNLETNITLVGENVYEAEAEVIVKGDMCGSPNLVDIFKSRKIEVEGSQLPPGNCGL